MARPVWLRRLSFLTSAVFLWSTLLAVPAQVLARDYRPAFGAPKPIPAPVPHDDPAWHTIDYHKSAPVRAKTLPARNSTTGGITRLTLLDEVGRLAQPVEARTAAAWKGQLHQAQKLSSTETATLHVKLGEYKLAQEQQPEQALWHFRQARKLSRRVSDVQGLAAYDAAIATFYEGAYKEARTAFTQVLTAKPGLHGFDRRACALFMRHASACAGYHAERSAIGIPEPPRLDPLCGASALAVALKAAGKPYDKKTVLAHIRVTGRGSSLADILDGATRMGLKAAVATADDKGLIALPKPLVAYVEHDHFIAVLHADANGVTYLCSDCGPWPGGDVHLSWKQWHKLEATLYGIVTRPDSDMALALPQLDVNRSPGAVGVQVASASLSPLALTTLTRTTNLLRALSGHVKAECRQIADWLYQGLNVTAAQCGQSPTSLKCSTCFQCCAMHNGNTAGNSDSPMAGEPTNLATGEEEYTPGADLVVYNPIGPAVVWSRLYDSLRPAVPGYEYDDFGTGWSQAYNVTVNQPATFAIIVPQGSSIALTTPIATAFSDPTHPYGWEVLLNGTSVASSSSPNGWSFTFLMGSYILAAPSGATVAQNYELRTSSNLSGTSQNAFWFDVVAPNTLPQYGSYSVDLQYTGAGTLTGPAGSWRIYQGSTLIASAIGLGSSTANGWTVKISSTNATATDVMVSPGANPGTGSYTIQWINAGNHALAANFTLINVNFVALPGAKFIMLENGAKVPFTASAMPLPSQTTVACSVAAGYPLSVEWDYDATGQSGHFVVTFANRNKFTTAVGTIATPIIHVLKQITDNNGNALKFTYGSAGPAGIPLLSSITDGSNGSLLSITRDAATHNIKQVSDRYGRSVYYRCSTYANQNVPSTYTQSSQELDHVSQVVTTPTASPPDRFVYGYQNVANGEGTETIPFLHTMTVPSPTGTGTQTGTINYEANTCGVASVVDANGNVQTFQQTDANHTQVTYKDSLGTIVYRYTMGYDMNMSKTTVTNGKVDGSGHNTQVVSAETYADASNPFRPSQVQDGNGYAAGGAGGLGTWTYTWDALGHCLTATTPRSVTTTNTYSTVNFFLGELTQTQTGGKQKTSFTYYQPSGNIHTVTSPLPGTSGGTSNITTTYAYSTLGNLTSVVTPGNGTVTSKTTTYNYTTDGTYSQPEAVGQPIAITDNLGKVTHFRYDGQGRVTSGWDALGNTSSVDYNIAGQLAHSYAPLTGQTGSGHSTIQNTYLYPDGPLTQTKLYDESGTQVRQVSPVYGAEGEQLTTTGDILSVTNTYDALYRPKTIADGNSHNTQGSYNSTGYATQSQFANGDTYQATTWDANGNVLSSTDGRGTTLTYVYNDVESRLTDIQYPAGSGLDVHIDYDGYGRPLDMTDSTGSKSVTYDDLDLTLTQTTTYKNAAGTGYLPSQTLTYSYNADGSQSSLVTPAGTFSYAFDGRGLLSSVSNPGSESFSWTYLDNGWLWTQTLGSAAKATYTYNALGQVTELAHRKQDMATTLLADFSGMSQDAVGNRVSLTASVPSTTAYSGSTSYTYSSKDQLTQESSTRAGSFTNNNAFDSVGNPTTFKGTSQSFNSVNQNTAGGTLTFDGNGNPGSWSGNTLTWDYNDKPTSIGSVLTAGYGADGLRAWKQNASSVRTYFLYDGLIPVCELDGSGNVTAYNTAGADGLLARHVNGTGGGSVFYCFDPQGSVSVRIDSSGTVLSTHCNEAWGTQVSTGTGYSADPYAGYGGQWGYYRDSETGLHLLGERYYDVASGRFLNRDPIEYEGGINLYTYCDNNPVDGDDAEGLCYLRHHPHCHWPGGGGSTPPKTGGAAIYTPSKGSGTGLTGISRPSRSKEASSSAPGIMGRYGPTAGKALLCGGVFVVAVMHSGGAASAPLDAWVAKELWDTLDPQYKEAVKRALDMTKRRGDYARAIGEQGIKRLGPNDFELKTSPHSQFGNYRLLGCAEEVTYKKGRYTATKIIFKVLDKAHQP